jgi:hypothetical protein
MQRKINVVRSRWMFTPSEKTDARLDQTQQSRADDAAGYPQGLV